MLNVSELIDYLKSLADNNSLNTSTGLIPLDKKINLIPIIEPVYKTLEEVRFIIFHGLDLDLKISKLVFKLDIYRSNLVCIGASNRLDYSIYGKYNLSNLKELSNSICIIKSTKHYTNYIVVSVNK
jgi:hypothetical protein